MERPREGVVVEPRKAKILKLIGIMGAIASITTRMTMMMGKMDLMMRQKMMSIGL